MRGICSFCLIFKMNKKYGYDLFQIKYRKETNPDTSLFYLDQEKKMSLLMRKMIFEDIQVANVKLN